MDNRSDIWRGVDAIKPRFIDLSDKVWAMPEVCYTEARSAAEHLAELRHQGFRITENVADIPTALIGEWGEGGPVIAFLGEYDALPGLSQEAGRGRASPDRGRRPWPWLRPQSAGLGRAARRHRGEGLARRPQGAGARALLRLPRRGGWCGEDLHGALGRLR